MLQFKYFKTCEYFCMHVMYILASKEPAETADVMMRLQKTRKSECLKYSFSAPYGILMIFSCKNRHL